MLGKKNDAEKYTKLAENIRKAFNKSFYKGEGIYANGSQTALSCALYQQLVEEKERNKVVEKLVADIEKNDGHIDTGILGAKYLFNALTANGKHDVAYRIATRTTPPSYGSWIKRGATTLWEDWTGVASLNHIMFGDISAWFYKNLAGINADPESPGFKHIIFHPQPVGDLEWVRAEHESMYGTIGSSWYRDSQSFKLDLTIPANTTATVYVPAKGIDSVTESGRPVDKVKDVRFLKMEDDAAVFEIGSGNYCFLSDR
jgi:alpha-L-rhamnosidase